MVNMDGEHLVPYVTVSVDPGKGYRLSSGLGDAARCTFDFFGFANDVRAGVIVDGETSSSGLEAR